MTEFTRIKIYNYEAMQSQSRHRKIGCILFAVTLSGVTCVILWVLSISL